MLEEAGRALQLEVDRQMALWGTEGWTTASNTAATDKDTNIGIDTGIDIDMDDPDAVMAQFLAKQKAKRSADESLPVKIWARNIVCMTKEQQQQQQPQSTRTSTNKPKEKEQDKELVNHLCLKFLEYQQL